MKKPKPNFDWEELEATARQPMAGMKTREDILGGFTVEELAARYNISLNAARQRIDRLVQRGAVRRIAVVSKITYHEDGTQTHARVCVYDLAKKS